MERLRNDPCAVAERAMTSETASRGCICASPCISSRQEEAEEGTSCNLQGSIAACEDVGSWENVGGCEGSRR